MRSLQARCPLAATAAEALSMSGMPAQPRGEGADSAPPVGTGPYVLERSSDGSEIVLA